MHVACALLLLFVTACKNDTLDSGSPPVVAPSASPMTGAPPLTVAFHDGASNGSDTIVSYRWTFGDGTTATERDATHVYASAGTFTATLTVLDDAHRSASSSLTIVVAAAANQPPSATASASPTSGPAPLAVQFTGAGSDPDGTIASYAWSFGDGGTSTSQSPSHTYTNTGSFVATLTITDNGGATASATVNVTVGTNRPPTASASATPTAGSAPLAVQFTGAGSDTDGTIVSYAWTFGDGGTSSQQSPAHTYGAAGNFTAVLTVTDNGGAAGSSSVAISVTSAGNAPPTATASATPTSGTAPLTVRFTGSGSDSDGTIVSYAWAFGDGATSSVQSPSHVYSGAGAFSAVLTVTDDKGATGSSSVAITVSAPVNASPVANAGPDQMYVDPGTTVTLNGSSSYDPDGSITGYQWVQTGGPAVVLSGANTPTPTFATPSAVTASYTFSLTVTDNGTPPASGQDSVVVGARVTYLNTTKALIDSRGTQPNGTKLGCTAAGCHVPGGQSPPLTTYAYVYANRSLTRSKIQAGQSMRKYLLTGEPEIITAWIDNGAPEKN